MLRAAAQRQQCCSAVHARHCCRRRRDRRPLDLRSTPQRHHTNHHLLERYGSFRTLFNPKPFDQTKKHDQSAEHQGCARIVYKRAAQRGLRLDGRGTVRQRHNKRTPGRRLDAGMNSHRAVTVGNLRTNYFAQANAEVRHAGNCRCAIIASSRLLRRDIR